MHTIELNDGEAQMLLTAIRRLQADVSNRPDLPQQTKDESDAIIQGVRQKLCKALGNHIARLLQQMIPA